MRQIEESINKGVPIEAPVPILSEDLILLSTNKDKMRKVIDQAFEQHLTFVFQGLKPIDIDFFKTLSIFTDSETLQRKVGFAPSAFLSSLLLNLNVGDFYYNFNQYADTLVTLNVCEAQELFLERIEVLKNIVNEKKLKREFPALYVKYQDKKKVEASLRQVLPVLQDSNLSLQQKLHYRKLLLEAFQKNHVEINDLDDFIDSHREVSLENFTSEYAQVLSEIVVRIPMIYDTLLQSSVDFTKAPYVEGEKLELYLAHQFLHLAEAVNPVDTQRFLYYVSSYFAEKPERKTDDNLKITFGGHRASNLNLKGKTITTTPAAIYQRYQELLISRPELHVIDFNQLDFSGMKLDEVEDFMAEYLKDLKANWEFLPRDDTSLEHQTLDSIRTSSLEYSEEDRTLERERLVRLYMAKKEFWDSTEPFYRIKGKNTFDGYVGYIYTNGKVLLDKYYENAKTGRLAEGQAIYSMDINDFYQMSQLPKQALIRHPACNRIIHRGNWQEKVTSMIENEGNSFQSAQQVNQLMKKGSVSE